MKYCVVFFSLVLAGVARGQGVDECLQKDSISCVQRALFGKVRELFDSENLEIAPGVSLVRSRGARKLKDQVEQAGGVLQSEGAIENFIAEEVKNFVRERSLKINFAPAMDKIGETARAVTEFFPSEVRKAADEVVEGRGKKKLLKTIIPLLLAAKLKIGMMATMAYFGIALIAKKAIFASMLSIAISTFLGLKSLWATKTTTLDSTAYSAGWNSAPAASSSWSAPAASNGWSGGSGWDDTHGSYSSPSQTLSGYQHS